MLLSIFILKWKGKYIYKFLYISFRMIGKTSLGHLKFSVFYFVWLCVSSVKIISVLTLTNSE